MPNSRTTRVRRRLQQPHQWLGDRPSMSIGQASAIASRSARCSAIAFGTSSPSETLRKVRSKNAIRNATVSDCTKSNHRWTSGSPMAPIAMPAIVIPTWTVLMKRGRVRPSAPARGSRPASAGVRELLQARSPRRHERVLGCDEERVPQHEQENRDDSKDIAHAPLSGAWVLGGRSSSKEVLGL